MTIRLTIDGREITVAPGTTIYDAARRHGIEIPVLCHHPQMEPVGVCRMCVVDVGGRVLAASCVRPCEEGLQVVTHSERVEKQRRMLTELLLAEHPTPCEKERTTGDCELEALGRHYALIPSSGKPKALAEENRRLRLAAKRDWEDRTSKVINVDHAACILCDRCIRACDDIQS